MAQKYTIKTISPILETCKFWGVTELVLNQGKLMDSLSKRLASNDKTLESVNIRMESFSNAINN